MMRLFISLFLGALFITMTANANASGTLVLETTKGEIRIALLETLAPNHVSRIKDLVSSGFYDGIVFHRVISGFMAQTGDPTGTGSGGSGQNIDAEFSNYAYKAGTVGMARTNNPNSGDSQFFICFDGCDHLTGQYTAWGQVEAGMETVESLNIGEPPPEPDQIIKAVIEE
jgi:peptidylprolyl isomerase